MHAVAIRLPLFALGVEERLANGEKRMALFCQLALDVSGDPLRRRLRCEALDDSSLLVDQEFGEVPLDGVAKQPAFLVLEELVQRVGAAAVDLDLREDREGHTVVELAERLNFGVGTGFLMTELIAREAKDFEAAVVVFGVE